MKNILSVTELNGQIKQLLEESFDVFWVEGEVSNLHRPASGHIYFTLKDENSQIRAVIFRYAAGKMPFSHGRLFDLENGMTILCRARLSVYQPRGEYQLLVDAVEPTGVGALQKAFEQLKARLQAEGLFDPALKKPLPFIPRKICVITSPTGAVIRDILNVTLRRFPSVDILIAPVSVQGTEAAGEIIRAIADISSQKDVDVLILARGGGSLEDLAPFNDEGVARAIFTCPVPIISAVGHETDFTIADFVADLRAPTPSAAAELVVPVRAELAATLSALRSRIIRHQVRLSERLREKLIYTQGLLPTPRRYIADLRLATDAVLDRVETLFSKKMDFCKQQLFGSSVHLRHLSPAALILNNRIRSGNLKKNMITLYWRNREEFKKRLEAGIIMLDTLSPLAVLRRGYSITKALPAGTIVKNVDILAIGGDVDITLAAGGFQARVTEIYGRETNGKGKV